MKITRQIFTTGAVALVTALLLLNPAAGGRPAAAAVQTPDEIEGPFVIGPAVPQLSPAVRDLAPASGGQVAPGVNPPRQNPLQDEPDIGRRGTWNLTDAPIDPLIQRGRANQGRTPGLAFSFDATGNPRHAAVAYRPIPLATSVRVTTCIWSMPQK
jgi:hypothetical protein